MPLARNRATEKRKREDWEMWVRMNQILCAVLRETHERQVEETMDALEDGPGRIYRCHLGRSATGEAFFTDADP